MKVIWRQEPGKEREGQSREIFSHQIQLRQGQSGLLNSQMPAQGQKAGQLLPPVCGTEAQEEWTDYQSRSSFPSLHPRALLTEPQVVAVHSSRHRLLRHRCA